MGRIQRRGSDTREPPLEASLDGRTTAKAPTDAVTRRGDPPNDASRGPASKTVTVGDSLGRYRLGARLGSGGMGTVFAAHDPKLDRAVAVKVLRDDRGVSAARELRLWREAQVMAKLSHPNVIRVYDVGIDGDRVFVAMEYVEGGTLEEWLTQGETRDARAILDLFVQAGRGLAAAHGAGLVHRDFKPSNVMVGRDGRVLVTDFGLAQPSATSGADEEGVPSSAESEHRPERLVGTPAYISPEQLLDGRGDARGDQFSFCVALAEALYGEHPFGRTLVARLAHVHTPPRLPVSGAAAAKGRVPQAVHRAIARGLRSEPDERHPSMDALLQVLARDPHATRRAWAFGGGAIAAAAGVAVLAAHALAPPANRCGGGEAKLGGVWDDARSEAVAQAFRATGAPFADSAFQAVRRSLDAYARGWVKAYVAACEATEVRREQSPELLDLRMACLSIRLQHTRQLTEVLAQADRQAVERAARAVEGLPAVEDCANVVALRGETALPASPEARARIAALRSEIGEVRALHAAGRVQEALPKATAILGEARSLRYRPVEAEAGVALGKLQNEMSDADAAIATLDEASQAAVAGHALRADIEAKTLLAHLVGWVREQPVEGFRWAARAAAALEAYGDDNALRAQLLNVRGNVALAARKPDDALGDYRAALTLFENLFGKESVAAAREIDNVGNALAWRGDYAAGIAEHARAIAIEERELGTMHPLVAYALMNLGAAQRDAGQLEEALAAHRRSLAIDLAAFGHDNLETADSLDNVGVVLFDMNRIDEAQASLREALAVKEKVAAPDDARIAFTLHYLALTLQKQHRLADAEATIRRALAIEIAQVGADAADAGAMRGSLAGILRERGKYADAISEASQAVRVLEAKDGPMHPDVARALVVLGKAQLDARHANDAARTLERALAIQAEKSPSPALRVDARLALASAYWALGGAARARARTLAEEAIAVARTAGAPSAEMLREAEAWAAAHR